MLLTCTSHVLSRNAPDLCSANKFYNMPANIITTDDLRQFKIELLDELKQLFGHRAETNTREYLKSSEVSKLLDISLSKLQHMRIRKVLPYTRIGSTIYYKREDIQTLLEANRKQAKVKSLSLFQK
jgi:Helix-turn-helix domain